MYCICCKSDNVKVIDPEDDSTSEETIIWPDRKSGEIYHNVKKLDTVIKMDGIATLIDAGYGSTYDGDRFAIAICDDCIKSSLEDGTLLYLGNYLSPYHQLTEEDVEKSKKIFRRSKNLDRL